MKGFKQKVDRIAPTCQGIGETVANGGSNACKQNPANPTRRIICKKELWVPSARIPGGRHLGGVLSGKFLNEYNVK